MLHYNCKLGPVNQHRHLYIFLAHAGFQVNTYDEAPQVIRQTTVPNRTQFSLTRTLRNFDKAGTYLANISRR